MNNNIFFNTKTIVLCMFVCLSCIPGLAQSHLSIMGVQLGGDYELFENKMRSKGAAVVSKDILYKDTYADQMNITYCGIKNCRMDIHRDGETKTTTLVNIWIPIDAYVDYINNDFLYNTLSKEYGVGSILKSIYGGIDVNKFMTDPDYYWENEGSRIEFRRKKNGFDYNKDYCASIQYIDYTYIKLKESKKHVKFKGHYVNEPNYVQKLLHDKKIWKENNSNEYHGYVGDYKCLLKFIPLDDGIDQNIAIIHISTDGYEKWEKLNEIYHSFAQLLDKKYNVIKLNENIGEINGLHNPIPVELCNRYALSNLSKGKGKFERFYEIPGGFIILKIMPQEGIDNPNWGRVMLFYIDEEYYERRNNREEQEKLNDL